MSSKNSTKPQLTGAALAAQEKRQAKDRADRAIRRWRKVRNVITFLAVAGIAVVATVVSFGHIRDLAVLAGQDATYWYSGANLTPVTVDLLMIIASFKLREVGATRLTRLISRIAMLIGLAASLAGNVGSAFMLHQGENLLWLKVSVAGWPVIPLLLATEMLTHVHKDAPVTKRKADGIIVLTRQIVRQAFINKLANMKARKGFTPKLPQVTLPKLPQVPTFPQLDPMIKATAAHMIDLRRARSGRVVPAQRAGK